MSDSKKAVIQQESRDKYSVVQNVKTRLGAHTMAVDIKTHSVYLSDADSKRPANRDATYTAGNASGKL